MNDKIKLIDSKSKKYFNFFTNKFNLLNNKDHNDLEKDLIVTNKNNVYD